MLKEIPLAKLRLPKRDSRFLRDEWFETFLAEDIEKETLLIPILVRPLEDGFFEIVDGATRYFALRQQGAKIVTCDVKEMTDETALIVRVKLNMNRKKTDYVGIASDLKELKEKGFKMQDLCERFGWKKAWIYRLLALNKLSFNEKLDVAEGRLTVTNAYMHVMEKQIPKHMQERKLTCSCCGSKEAEHMIAHRKLCMRCDALLQRAHEQQLKFEKVSKRHKRLVY